MNKVLRVKHNKIQSDWITGILLNSAGVVGVVGRRWALMEKDPRSCFMSILQGREEGIH